MAQSSLMIAQESISNDNSISTKEFLNFEKSCEAYKDCDDELKMLFSEITKLTGTTNKDNVISADVEDVEMILKRAEDLAIETENLLKSTPLSPTPERTLPNGVDSGSIPQIKVTKPMENSEEKPTGIVKANQSPKHTVETRRKPKTRPASASVIDSKKKASSSPKKQPACKHEKLIEELKDTSERVKGLELLNVKLTDDNKALRKNLDSVHEQKHVADLKLAECEKFISRLGKQYEGRNLELKASKENESRLIAELAKERNERKNLTIRHEKDGLVIQDLQRQVKEMEMILRRKHPDSVSALIVAAKSSSVEDNKKKLLEDRISRLEQELKDKEDHFHGVMLTLQEKFGDMKQKYENHIVDVERQLMDERKLNTELKNKINKVNSIDTAVQTATRHQHNMASQTVLKSDRASSAVSRMPQNSALILNKLREDSYLVATIKGLQTELTMKQRTIAKINRETEELKKNLRNLQKEKEVLLNLNPQKKSGCKQAKSAENIVARINSEMEAELVEARKQKDAFMLERNSLLDSLKRSNEELIILKKKRIQDLHTLQLAHEKELMQMNLQVYPLQEEVKLLSRTVEILQERIRAADDKLVRYQAGLRDIDGGGDNFGSKTSFKRDTR